MKKRHFFFTSRYKRNGVKVGFRFTKKGEERFGFCSLEGHLYWVLVVLTPPNSLSALAGMSLAFLLESLDEVQFSVKITSEVENLMTSVERVMAYTKLQEEPGYSTEVYPPESWPQRGSITISKLSLRYIEGGPRVLKDINLSIADKEKIGVVGRTGAGKSSLVASLLRMPDPEGKVRLSQLRFSTPERFPHAARD